MAKTMKTKVHHYYHNLILFFALLFCISAIGFFFYKTAVPKTAEATGYQIYVFPDGTGRVTFDNINHVQQLRKDVKIDGVIYKAGTLILPGNGDEAYYDYVRSIQYE